MRLTRRVNGLAVFPFKNGFVNVVPEDGYREVFERLAAYEDAMPLNRVKEFAQSEKDGRLVILPCNDKTAYTIQEDYFACDKCEHKAEAHFDIGINRVCCSKDYHCPYYIKGHKVEGFEISFDKNGNPKLSFPGEFGYEGLETFKGIDMKCYFTYEEAEQELKKLQEKGNE